MSWLALGIKIASAIGSIATAYSVSQIAPSVSDIVKGGIQALTPQTPVSTADKIKAAEHAAENTQTLTGTDNPQAGTSTGLPDQNGANGKLIAALAALGLGAGALGAVAVARTKTGRKIGRRVRRRTSRFTRSFRGRGRSRGRGRRRF